MSYEMTAFISRRLPDNFNLPRLNVSEQEIDILKMSPSMWVESTSGVVSSGTNVTMIRDKTGKATWKPAGAVLPRLGASNNVPVFNFGRSVNNSGAMIAEGAYESLPADGIYSLAILYRIPEPNTSGYAGTGGNVVGNYAPTGEWLRVHFGNDSYEGNAVWLNHGGTAASIPENYPINTTIPGFRDNKWHTAFIEATDAFHRWEHDGSLLQQKAIPAAPFSSAASRQLVIGGATNPLSHGLMGEIAAVLLIPGVLPTASKSIIYERLNAFKASLTQV
ncbi:hypothetical protein [Serratia proteamaculans]|uniref:hypothetical protein n=1 Tax=Serratia proteamaculans TaxID=28151 RepID=UPI00101FF2F7|nr:hypothetical protein [Serratia proteamaculans]RYM49118.1 hypothetical protein BSQ97_19560 [Serratia proteamaculans]